MQVQRVEIFDPHSGHHAANLPELLASLGIVEFKSNQLDCQWRQRRMKIPNFRANAILGQRVLDLSGDVMIDKAELVSQ